MTDPARTNVYERLMALADKPELGFYLGIQEEVRALAEEVRAVQSDMRQRAAKIKAANEGPDSYYHVAGDEPVDFVLDDEIIAWADRLAPDTGDE